MSPPISLHVLDIQTHLLFTSVYFLMSRIFFNRLEEQSATAATTATTAATSDRGAKIIGLIDIDR